MRKVIILVAVVNIFITGGFVVYHMANAATCCYSGGSCINTGCSGGAVCVRSFASVAYSSGEIDPLDGYKHDAPVHCGRCWSLSGQGVPCGPNIATQACI